MTVTAGADCCACLICNDDCLVVHDPLVALVCDSVFGLAYAHEHRAYYFTRQPSGCCRYHEILDCLEAHGLEPNATLHHFTHPQWFEKLGGFADAKNIPLFVKYAQIMFKHFGKRIRFWASFNEPTCFCLVGYIMGMWCPGKRARLVLCGKVRAGKASEATVT